MWGIAVCFVVVCVLLGSLFFLRFKHGKKAQTEERIERFLNRLFSEKQIAKYVKKVQEDVNGRAIAECEGKLHALRQEKASAQEWLWFFYEQNKDLGYLEEKEEIKASWRTKPFKGRHEAQVLVYWNRLFHRSEPFVLVGLQKMGKSLGLNAWCTRGLVAQGAKEQEGSQSALYIHTLGNLSQGNPQSVTREVLEILEKWADSKSIALSFESWVALMKINGEKYAEKVLSIVENAGFLSNKELKHLMSLFVLPQSVALVERKLSESVSSEKEGKLFKLCSTVPYFHKFATALLKSAQELSIESLCLCLKSIQSVKDLEPVQWLVEASPLWFVHVSALQGLLNCSLQKEEFPEFWCTYMEKKIEDKNWWVRLRAAEVFVSYWWERENGVEVLSDALLKLQDDYGKQSLSKELQRYGLSHARDNA